MDIYAVNECLKNLYPDSEIHYEIDTRCLPKIKIQQSSSEEREKIYIYLNASAYTRPRDYNCTEFCRPRNEPVDYYDYSVDYAVQEEIQCPKMSLREKKRQRKLCKQGYTMSARPPRVQYECFRNPCRY